MEGVCSGYFMPVSAQQRLIFVSKIIRKIHKSRDSILILLVVFFIFDVVFICHWIQSYYDDIWSVTARCACVLVCILTTATVKLPSYQICTIVCNICDSSICSYYCAIIQVCFVFSQSIVNLTYGIFTVQTIQCVFAGQWRGTLLFVG